jgi:flagellar hook-associated protein 1
MSLFSSLNIGTSGLKASETAISVTGHNISNADNPSYTRQRVVQQARTPMESTPGSIGTGVKITSIVRIHDEFVYSRYRNSSSALSYDSYLKQSLEEVAGYFPDLDGVGVEQDIQNYFAAWNDFASNADDGSQKISLVQNAQTFASNLQNSRKSIRALQNSINGQLKTNIDDINSIGQQIVDINKSIARIESLDTNRANDLRDQRDKLEVTLANLIDASVFKGDLTSQNNIDAHLTDQGKDYHVNISGHSFVDGVTFHPLVIDNSNNSSNYFSVYSESQDGSRVEITDKLTGGKVGAMLDLRGRKIDPAKNEGYPADGILQGYIDDLDTFANTFIEQTNNIYAQSAQEQMTSKYNHDLLPSNTLKSYNKNIKEGNFDVIIYDKQGNEVARKAININSTTSMGDDTFTDSIVTQFNANSDDNADSNATNDVDDYFQAFYTYDETTNQGHLSFQAKPEHSLEGYTIAVEDHGTNFAGAVGLSEFLSGENANDIGVASKYIENPDTINGFSAPVDGNNDVANAMVQLQYDGMEFHRKNGSTVNEGLEGFYRFVTNRVANDGESANNSYETNTALYNTIYGEYQSISGVNVDEELTNLMKYQASYGANAKVITTIDQMLDTLLGIKS